MSRCKFSSSEVCCDGNDENDRILGDEDVYIAARCSAWSGDFLLLAFTLGAYNAHVSQSPD